MASSSSTPTPQSASPTHSQNNPAPQSVPESTPPPAFGLPSSYAEPPKSRISPVALIITTLATSALAIYGTLQWTQHKKEIIQQALTILGQPVPQPASLNTEPPPNTNLSPLPTPTSEPSLQTQASEAPAPISSPTPLPAKTIKKPNPFTPPALAKTNAEPEPSESFPNLPDRDPAAPKDEVQKQEAPDSKTGRQTVETSESPAAPEGDPNAPEKFYEKTLITVPRHLQVYLKDGNMNRLNIKVPVMFRSRTFRVDEAGRKTQLELLKNLKAESQELQQLKTKIEASLAEWNKFLQTSGPTGVLNEESPSLPPGTTPVKTTNPDLAPGKGISFEVVPAKN